ncbi:MAG: Swt1 family HEPN domain-containing protein [Oscillochloridaceae bacterium]|nr:Swt1 family HEPN domain-containing protein [Chloroflexaceae bacterium]MDW8392018.1 Swt1 family HEPN domain-containing protein [Oscillochloridaceae bacterium]
MATTNHERVGKAMDLLRQGLLPFVEREAQTQYGKYWVSRVTEKWRNELTWRDDETPHLDIAALLKIMGEQWNEVFRKTLGFAERSLVSELREARNKWAHQESFSSDDAYRALDSAHRLLTAISAPQAEELERMKMELLRLRFDEQVRSERRKSAGAAIESAVTGALKPWRDVITPHPDVASGRYLQAEFAADLWQVHLGEGSDEYRNPVEFFRRTYLTESLTRLLVGAIRRLSGAGGDPVVQLQTNFGGGKTHSMLALYHLFGGANPTDLAGMDRVMQEAGVTTLPTARRVVLVGNKISPGNPVLKPDGTLVRTLWGELAWQLGGRDAFERVRLDDERATNPGDTLRALFNDYGPCLILVDEWVAYARQLHDQGEYSRSDGAPLLPGGSFETQFSFAQALTESARLAKHCLLVVSLPASDTAGSPYTQADDAEVGGQRGREALERLRNVIGRLESSWRPASAEEGFEIVRRRLFEPLRDPAQFKDRDVVARAFADLYRSQAQEFPPECRESSYEQRLKAAYPIHPEVFDRLYTDWSTLVKFQRTRGVLRLMAAVIHSLWEKGDRNPLIMPANVPIDEPRVQFELTRYLSDNWAPILEKDVDGPGSLPLQIDRDVPNLGKYAATRRVARAIYLGSAPTATAANRGIEDRRIKLGCVMPGESPAVFGDALRRLAASATYLYQDGSRYWYATQPTVTKLAEDRAEQLRRDPDRALAELERRLRADLRKMGDFSRVHPLPVSGADVPDDLDARLVVLGVDAPYSKEADNPAEARAREILEKRGNAPRLYRNSLVFLAADKTRVQDLDEALRRYLAWESILAEKESLDLSPNQVRQAETQKASADGVVTARLPETYQWLLVPAQATPQAPVEWKALRLSGQDALAVRASKKLRGEELLILSLAPSSLRLELDRVPLWRGDHVSVRQLIEDFGRYHYLPRLRDPGVLLAAIREGVNLLTWELDSFAYAEGHDEAAGRYRGLRAATMVSLSEHDGGLIVRPEAARRQLDAEMAQVITAENAEESGDVFAGGSPTRYSETSTEPSPRLSASSASPVVKPRTLRRFHGSVEVSAERAGRDASRIAEEVIAHLTALVGARVRVTLEIEAEIPGGAPDHVVRVVTENSRALKFTQAGFEEE